VSALAALREVQSRLRASVSAARDARAERDECMRRAYEAGASQAEIARATGLSRAQVQRILDYSRGRRIEP
jgi:DNA-binding transcriptional regulator LsrR (DeoR family)